MAVLVGFVVVAAIVVTRRTYALRQNKVIVELDRERKRLESHRVRLESDIREASSRARLLPIAEQKLQMRIAPDQIVDLPRPPRRTAASDGKGTR
jgi:cell division protein FtsL